MKQFLEALLRNSSAQRKDDVVHHFVRGFEGRPEDAGVAMSSMMDIHSDWYGEDTGERTRGSVVVIGEETISRVTSVTLSCSGIHC